MDFQFVLPEKTSDLLKSSGDHFFVRQVYTLPQLRGKLEDCRSALRLKDPSYIIEHFDSYYSVIELKDYTAETITWLTRSFDLLFISVKNLEEKLTSLFSAAHIEDRTHYLNLTKMTIFLLVNVVKRIDVVIKDQQEKSQMNQQKKRTKQSVAMLEQCPDWERKQVNFFVLLHNVFELHLEKLWSPPVVEEDFVNMICDVCYRTLETTPLRAETRKIVETVFQIFGVAIKRYNHALTFPVRILQMLRRIEHVAHSLPVGINLLHEEYSLSSVFEKLVTEILEALTLDAADTAVSRHFSTFLTEFANVAPKLMIPHLSLLSDELLSCESHVLRNCVLQIMGEGIVGELTSENLSEEMKEARDEFLDDLLSHINDISAHVRSKVLHIWQNLKVEEAVPLSFQLKVLKGAVERLEDKTSTVRKQAVQLIKAFLERNPFSSKLTLDELVKKHDEECINMEKLSEAATAERKKAEELDVEWEQVVPELTPIVVECIEANAPVDDTPAEPVEFGPRIAELLVAKEYKKAMEMARRAEHASANEDLSKMLKNDEKCLYYISLLKSYLFLANGCKDLNEELGTQIKTVQFLQDSIEFSKVVTKAVPKIQEMLLSKTNSDVFEAVELFTTGFLFGIKGTECGMRCMLNLVWSSEKEKRDAVSNAYRRVLFTTDQIGRAHAIKVVQNLSRFIEEIDCGNYMAMECLVAEWISTEDIDGLIVQVLFERFTMKLEGTTENESKLALQLLIMCSQTKSTIASMNMNVIESIGLGDRGKRDPLFYSKCLEFLLNSIDQSMSTKYYKRYEPETPIVQKVIQMYTSFFFHPRIKNFDQVTMRSLEYFYKLSQKPDVICQQIVLDLLLKFQNCIKIVTEISASQQAQSMETPFSQPIPESQTTLRPTQTADNPSSARMPTFLLTRFIFMIGYMTLKEMIFLDIDVYNNQKFRQELGEFEEKNKKNMANHLRRRTNALNMSATESLKRLSGTAAEPQQEPDDDLVGATAEDNIAEMITYICEDVLLYDEKSLLSKIYPYIVEICKYPAKYRDQNLQQAATLTLIRFMCVSSKFCETYLPFLMNILNHTKNVTIKCNIVIGLSDLTFRFPNNIEPWTGHFYSTLHEEDTELRLTAVKMLSHLILHEMIRVKGQIADLAMCIVDVNDEIRNITQQFFKEIANKSNILYNVLPDIISKLTDINANLEEEKYRTIMRYILGLIQKDRQVETLVEKLCLRFPAAHAERQCRDIAYCLSLLSYNERTIKKLIDNVHMFKDKVQVDEVYQSFKLIINNTSKMAKPELRTIVAEFETRLSECLKVRDSEDRETNVDEAGHTQPGTGAPDRRKSARGRNVKNARMNKTRNTTTRSRRRQSSTSESSSSESSDTEDDEPRTNNKKNKNKSVRQKTTAAKTTSNRTRSIVVEESVSSEDERPKQKRGRSKRS